MEPQHRHKSTTHKEMYAHVQKDIDRWRGGTVFARREDDGHWYANAALCLKIDPFCKRIGRTIARRRYMKSGNGIGGPLHMTGYKLIIKEEYPDYEELKLIYEQACVDHIN